MRRIGRRKELKLEVTSVLSPYVEPIATIKPCETLEVETWDAFGGVIRPGQTYSEAMERGVELQPNPVTGPLYVEGAEPGGILIVDILDIELPKLGAQAVIPGFGALEGWLRRLDSETKFYRISGGRVLYERRDGRVYELEAQPFIGTIGVAPAFEAIISLSPGPHGGNMDCPDVRPGSRLMLPVFRQGGLLSLGDVHALQGDGEICGTAVEVPAVVRLRIDVERGRRINWPRIESEDEIMAVCSARPLEDAVRLAFLELIEWMASDYGWDRMDAYMFLSLTAKIRVAQVVDPLYTVVAKLPKSLLT